MKFNWLSWFFDFMYRFRRPRWDTGITPPEVVSLVESGSVKSGRALDLGCGTGTNSIYLAKHGFQVVGVDFAPKAIEIARAKALKEHLPVDFKRADVSRLDFLQQPFELVLDIGCFHSLGPEARTRYANQLARLTRPGSYYMLYAFGPHFGLLRNMGITREQIEECFGPAFELRRVDVGRDGGDRTSAWYWFVRKQ